MIGPVVAVGTSLGVTLVLQLPSLAAAASASLAPSRPESASSQAGTAPSAPPSTNTPLLLLGEARNEAESVTALGFSYLSVPGDPMWLMVGHASGSVVVWDVQKRPARQVAIIGEPLLHTHSPCTSGGGHW